MRKMTNKDHVLSLDEHIRRLLFTLVMMSSILQSITMQNIKVFISRDLFMIFQFSRKQCDSESFVMFFAADCTRLHSMQNYNKFSFLPRCCYQRRCYYEYKWHFIELEIYNQIPLKFILNCVFVSCDFCRGKVVTCAERFMRVGKQMINVNKKQRLPFRNSSKSLKLHVIEFDWNVHVKISVNKHSKITEI